MAQVAAALIVLIASSARAAEPASVEPVVIRADRIVYHVPDARFEATGSAEVRRGESSLRADAVSFDEPSGRGVAEGDVVIADGPDTLEASSVEFNVYTFEGVVLDGRFRSEASGFRAEAARIEKTGKNHYRFEDGRFTTCDCPGGEREPWAIRAGQTELEIKGYGTARNARFEVLGVPVVWLPWMLYPVKTKRQSGLLLPQFGLSGRHGVELGLPVFLAAGDPVNVTLTPRWLQKRGPKGDVELEWVLGRESGGDLFGSFLSDQEVQENTPSEPFDEERWVVKGREDLFLPLASRAKADFQFVSDNQYPTDFEALGPARAQRFLESTAFVARGFGRSGALGLMGAARFADDLQNPDDGDRDDFVLQRLPEVGAALVPTRPPLLSWLVPAMGVRYTWFNPLGSAQKNRPDGMIDPNNLFLDTGIDSLPDEQERGPDGGPEGDGPDNNNDNFDKPGGTERDGFFQEGEPLADSGHRVLLTPRLGLPLRLLDLFELYPEVGWHQTLYQSDAQNFEQRGLLTGRVDLRTRLRRYFGRGFAHVLEPRVGWAFVADRGQATKPFYVPRTAVAQRRLRQLDLENRVLDPADRIEDVNALTVGFGNRLYAAGAEGPSRLVADVVVSAAYEAAEGDFGVVYLDGRVHPWEQANTWFVLGVDPEEGRLDEGLLDLLWRFAGGHHVGIGYRYLRQVGRFFESFPYARERFSSFRREFDRVNQITGSGRLALTDRWALTYRGGFSFEEEIVLANRGGIEYLSGCGCWSVGVELAQDRVSGVSLSFSYSLFGLARDDVARGLKRRRSDTPGFLDAL